MRPLMLILSLVAAAAPAMAAPNQPSYPPQYYRAEPQIGQVLADPALPDQLGRVAGALTRSLMNVPVGEVEAAIEGRPVTRADRQRTIGDSMSDRYADQRIADQAAASGRTMQTAGKALARSLPAIMQAIAGAQADVERALGNLPNPNYPRR